MIPGCSSDWELLSNCLLKRLSQDPTAFPIPEKDVYGIEPWKLFNDPYDEATSSNNNNNLMYFITKIKKKNTSGGRIDRTVSTSLSSSPENNQVIVGTWKGQSTTRTAIKDEISNKIVGKKKMFSFKPKQDHDEDDEGGNGKRKRRKITTNNIDQLNGVSYIMHEYSTVGSSYVLCRIRRKIDKNKKMKYSCSKNTVIRENTCGDDQDQDAENDQQLQGKMSYDDHHQMMMTTSVRENNQSSMRQQQQPVQSAAAVAGGLSILIDDANMNTCLEGNTVPSTFAQDFADMLLDTTTPITIAQDIEDILVPNTFAHDLLADKITGY